MMKAIFYLFILLFLVSMGHAQTLEDYLNVAAENNPGLKASYAEFEASLKRVAQVNALPDPKLSFGYFLSPIETRVGAQQAKISLTQLFPWFGTLKAREDAATLQAEAKYQAFLDKKNKVFLRVKKAYFPLYELQEHIRIQKQNLVLLESYRQQALTSFSNGVGTMTDVLRAEIRIEGAQTDILVLKDRQYPLQVQFNRLLNRPDSLTIIIEETLPIKLGVVFENVDSLVSQNPRITQLERTLQALEAQEKAAEKNGLPQLGIGLDYAFITQRTDVNVPENGRDAIMPMVTMSIPVFRKKYKAAVEESQLLQSSVSYKIQDVENELVSSYEVALYQQKRALQLDSLYERQIEKSKQVLNLLYSEYGNSGKDFEEVLKVQHQLLNYEIARATARKEFQVALAQIEYFTAIE